MSIATSLRRASLAALVTLVSAGPLGIGCSTGPELPVAEDLRTAFPKHAARILDEAEPFAPVEGGFAVVGADAQPDATRGGLRARLPQSGAGHVRMSVGLRGRE